jgi:hypothetical protein
MRYPAHTGYRNAYHFSLKNVRAENHSTLFSVSRSVARGYRSFKLISFLKKRTSPDMQSRLIRAGVGTTEVA